MPVSKKFISHGENDTVYARIEGKTILSLDGGVSWPDEKQFIIDTIPDSLILDFPLVYISPHNPNLMIGTNYGNFDAELVTSDDRGKTKVIANDSLDAFLISTPFDEYKDNVSFDLDSATVYLASQQENNRTLLVRSSTITDPASCRILTQFSDIYHPNSSTKVKVKLFLWNNHEIIVSTDYGESFDQFYHDPDSSIIHVATASDRVFLTTPYELIEVTENGSTVIKSFTTVAIEDSQSRKPQEFELHQNYPNPFNPSTKISFSLSESTSVTLEIFNVLGQRVTTLINEQKYSRGRHAISYFADNSMSSGIYFYRLNTGTLTETKTMTLIK